ncbi:MAG TPA: hypothetical protein VIV11_33260 [Kofleriaceae bacterium]
MDSFDFIPFDDPAPAEGSCVDLRLPNREYAAELAAYQAALKFNPFAENNVCESYAPRLVDSPEELIGADEVCVPQGTVTLVVGYPFSGQYAVAINASASTGFTRAELFRQVARVYSAMFDGARFSSVEHLENTHVESPRFGTAWHVLDDLVIEEVLLQTREDGRVLVWIYIGS